MNSKEILRNLGFSEYETKVLLYLDSIGQPVDAKEIAKESCVPLTKLYSILIKLKRQNFIIKLPGKINLYRNIDRKQLIKNLKEQKDERIKQEKEKFTELSKLLESSLKGFPTKEVSVRYFTSDKDYWKIYNEEVAKLGKKDTYKIINNMRWVQGFLPEEIKDRPNIKSMITADVKLLKQGKFKLHHMVNIQALIQNTINDLKTKEKIKRSIAQLLYYYGRPDLIKHHYITIAPELKNILIVILKESIFFEFYSPIEHTKILSAVQIKSKEITKDFAKWFDAYSKEKHSSKKDFEKFKKEILKYAKELAKINPKDIEKAIKEVKPVYG